MNGQLFKYFFSVMKNCDEYNKLKNIKTVEWGFLTPGTYIVLRMPTCINKVHCGVVLGFK